MAGGFAVTSRIVILLSAVLALTCEIALARRSWTDEPAASLIAALIGITCGWYAGGRIAGIVLAVGAVAPLVVNVAIGRYYYPYSAVWLAAMIGVVASGPGWLVWSLPARWRPALALWALCISISWPIIVLREADFQIAHIVDRGGIAVTSVVHAALVHMLGILWLDWLFARFHTPDPRAFGRAVIVPCVVAAVFASGFAAYQGLFQLAFLSGGPWPLLGRAAGSLIDSNASGVMAALWGPPAIAIAVARRSRLGVLAGVAALIFGWLGLWATGSRTAFAAGSISLAFLVVYTSKALSSRTRQFVGVAGVITATCVVVFLLSSQRWSSVSPVHRILASVPEWSGRGLASTTRELWVRNGYGIAASRVIQEFPAFGVGIGGFPMLAGDYGVLTGVGRLPGDNAQNWFRHQLAELGLIGSMGWVVWVGMFITLVVRTRGRSERAFPAGVVKGLLAAIGIVSLVGMPTQNPAVALTFWTFVFWYVMLVDPSDLHLAAAPPTRRTRLVWVLVWMLAVTYAVGTAYVGWTRLRIPYRAVRAGWDYMYGFHQPEPASQGGTFRWAEKRAVAVIPAETQWLELTVWVNHFDIQRNPVEAKVWWEDTLVLHTTLRSIEPAKVVVDLPGDRRRAMIETWVSRTVRPLNDGVPDGRELGLAVQWRFLPERHSGGSATVTDAGAD